jgi:hypothetical protein
MKKRCEGCGKVKTVFDSNRTRDFDGTYYTVYICYECYKERE